MQKKKKKSQIQDFISAPQDNLHWRTIFGGLGDTSLSQAGEELGVVWFSPITPSSLRPEISKSWGLRLGSQVSEEKSVGWTGPLRHGQVWGGVREREKRLLVTDSAWERHSLHCAENLTCTHLPPVGSQSPKAIWTKGQEQLYLLLRADLTWILNQ